MLIRVGFDIAYDCPAPTPMLLMLSVRPEKIYDLVAPALMTISTGTPSHTYHDEFGNFCTRLLAPPGPIAFTTDFLVRDSGEPEPIVPDAMQHPVEDLPDQRHAPIFWVVAIATPKT